ncbi:MAG TPA: ankyrin repeat domain-containing protein, partial [Chthonomonadaceae bacterium]|nr:ankyrin repeat domain-containing protein [Chthonomonadaceae bacterium]
MKIHLRQALLIGLILVLALLLMGAGRYRQMASEDLTPAAQRGDTAAVRSCLLWRPDPNTPDRNGEAPLPAAVKYRHFDTAGVLLRAGADPNGKILRGSGNSLLTEAIMQGQFAFANDLIAHGAKVNPDTGEPPISAALEAPAAGTANAAAQQMLTTLLAHGASVNPSTSPAPLQAAAHAGRPDLVKMLAERGARVDAGGDSGNSLLIEAGLGGSGAVWDQFRQMGARPDGHDPGWAQVWAQDCLDADWARRLQAAHISVNAGGTAGQISRSRTALMLSVADARRVRALLSLGADLELRTEGGNTALNLAAQKGSQEAIGLLLAHGARIEERGYDGATALAAAASLDRPDVVAALLAAGANPNAADAQGETPLLDEARTGDLRAAQLLLARGADPNAVERAHGWTPIMVAIQSGHPDLIPLLLSKGAHVNTRDKAGETALFLAARRPDTTPVEPLLHAGADVNA